MPRFSQRRHLSQSHSTFKDPRCWLDHLAPIASCTCHCAPFRAKPRICFLLALPASYRLPGVFRGFVLRWVYCITINSIVKQFFLLICLCICVILINTFNLFVIPSKHGKNAKAKNRGARNPPSARLLGQVPRSLEGKRPERCGHGLVCQARESRASQIE